MVCDAGGSKTRCLVLSEDMKLVRVGFGGPGNHLEIGIDAMLESLEEALGKVEGEDAHLALAGVGLRRCLQTMVRFLSSTEITASTI